MSLLLGILLFSWFLHSACYIPFIQLLYKFRVQRLKQTTRDAFDKRTPIFDKFHSGKVGTPVGGGFLIILLTSILAPMSMILMRYFWVPVTSVYPLLEELKVLLFTFVGFGILGCIDDMKKTFGWDGGKVFGLRMRHKLGLQLLLSLLISYWLVFELKIDIFYIPFVGVMHLGWLYIPFAMFVIIAFANAFNITDGLDGLAAGVLTISLLAFWFLSASILDTTLSVFIAFWLGGLLAFLYFNVYPARIFLGDVGSLAFGATLAVVGLILGKTLALVVMGGIFVIEAASSLIQLLGKKYLKRKIFAASPLHLWLQYHGWPEPKIVQRFWIISIVLSIFGLWLAILSKYQ